jgi:hypothetical protein
MKTSKFLSASIFGAMLSAVSPVLGGIAFFASILFGGTASGSLFIGIFDPTGLTLPTDGLKEASKLIFLDKFVSPSWKEFMDVEPGIKHDTQIVMLGSYNGLAGAVRSGCDNTPNPDSISNQEKTWQPKYISDRFEDCFDNLQSTFWKYLLANGLDKENLQDSYYADYVINRVEEYMNDDMMQRLIFFTDTAIVSGGTNNLTAGQLKYFNPLDGIFKQCEAIVAAATTQRVTITENANATYALQQFATPTPTVHPVSDYLDLLTIGNGTTTVPTMELRGVSSPIILVTQSVADQYARERKAATASVEIAYMRTETGIKYFEYNGVKILPIPTWDRLIKRHFDNGTKYLNPHRMLYTSTDNLVLGTEEESNLSAFRSAYSEYHKKWFAEFGFNLDVKVKQDKLVQYGY